MKIIKIKTCSECQWWDWDWCYHPAMQTDEGDPNEIDVDTSEYNVFPDWCPLEAAPEEGLKMTTTFEVISLEGCG